MKNKIVSVIAAVGIMLVTLSVGVVAAETFTYSISVSPSRLSAGDEFEVVISLTNYDTVVSELRGLQIDVTNIDTDIFEVVSHQTMIDDAVVASNQTSYQPSKNLVRLVYVKFSGAMDKSVSDVMKFRLKIKDDIASSGSVTLPVILKFATMNENITVNDTLTVDYAEKSSDVVSVDVSWGSMEFTYDDGMWDTSVHKWVDGSWKPIAYESNLISVRNSGNTDVKMKFSYTQADGFDGLFGAFYDMNGIKVDAPIVLNAGSSEEKYKFNLSGTTKSRWNDEFIKVGNITVTITE